MRKEVSTPNIVVDDNYRMLVKRLTRRYAERGASVYADADAIEQERCDARARAIAPDAYRISRALGDNPEMYKSPKASGARYMSTDDYLVYFSKCHDAFEAVNYYNLHAETSANPNSEKLRVLVNKKRMDSIKAVEAKRQTRANTEKKTVSDNEKVAPRSTARAERPQEEARGFFLSMSAAKRRMFAGLTAAAASIAVVIGGALVFAPADEAPSYVRSVSEENAVAPLVDIEGQEFLQNVE